MGRQFRVHGPPYENIDKFRAEYPGLSLDDALKADIEKARSATRGTGTCLAILAVLVLWMFAFGNDPHTSGNMIGIAKFIGIAIVALTAFGWWRASNNGQRLFWRGKGPFG